MPIYSEHNYHSGCRHNYNVVELHVNLLSFVRFRYSLTCFVNQHLDYNNNFCEQNTGLN